MTDRAAGFIPGIEFDFGAGRVYTLAPLSVGTLIKMQKRLNALTTAPELTPESMFTVLQAAHASMRRNYPNMTEEEVGELVDVSNMLDVISAVMDVGGFKRKAAEDAKNPSAQSTVPEATSTGLPS